MATSVYSYSSTRDFSQYVKDFHGRRVHHIAHPLLNPEHVYLTYRHYRNFNTLNEAYILPSGKYAFYLLEPLCIAKLTILVDEPEWGRLSVALHNIKIIY
jgi:hypothetical protein